MAIGHAAGAEQLGRRLAELLSGEAAVEALWVCMPESTAGLWLVTAPVEMDVVRRLHDLAMGLHAEFPSVDFEVQVLNRAWYSDTDPLGLIPEGATQILQRGQNGSADRRASSEG